MDRKQAQEWLKVWDQAHKPGSVVDLITWAAENGYSLVQGEPTEPLSADEVWGLVSETQTLHCVRCGRKYRPDEREQLVDAGEGKLKCDPSGPLYDACMRIYNNV